MVRIEGIPVAAGRLADAQKVKSTHAHNKRRTTGVYSRYADTVESGAAEK